MDRSLERGVKKKGISTDKNAKPSVLINLSDEEKKNIEKVKELIVPILEKYPFIRSFNELFDVVENNVPIDIFVNELTILEAVVKYLKEEKNFSLGEIADLLKRDERNIWHAYDNAKKKYSKSFKIKTPKILIPVSIFEKRKLSMFEALVFYLKSDLGIRFSKIAILLNRDARTIWTIWNRTRKKYGK